MNSRVQNFNSIGIYLKVETQQQAKSQDDSGQQAIKILEDKGVTFTNIKQTDEIAQTLLTVGLPTTYFVDSEGSRII